jgi:hypothetical protein
MEISGNDDHIVRRKLTILKIPSDIASISNLDTCDESHIAARLRRILMFLVCPSRTIDPVIFSAQGNTFRLDRFINADNPILANTFYKCGSGKDVSALERINWLLHLAPTLLNRILESGIDKKVRTTGILRDFVTKIPKPSDSGNVQRSLPKESEH